MVRPRLGFKLKWDRRRIERKVTAQTKPGDPARPQRFWNGEDSMGGKERERDGSISFPRCRVRICTDGRKSDIAPKVTGRIFIILNVRLKGLF